MDRDNIVMTLGTESVCGGEQGSDRHISDHSD